MKICKLFLAAVSVILLVSCSQKSSVCLSLPQAEDGTEVVLKRLDVDVWHIVDTLKLKNGKVTARLAVSPSSPQFLYFYYAGRNVSAVILKNGEKIEIDADTLGTYTVSGSEDSEYFRQFNLNHSAFVKTVQNASSPKQAGEAYVAHYQKNVKFLAEHPHSMVNVPMIFEKIDSDTPVFSQTADAVRFRMVTDSLKSVYPDSPFVKALEKETELREKALEFQLKMGNSDKISYPELNISSMDGTKASLCALDSKVVLLYFWNADDARQKMFNIEYLLPLYRAYNSSGFDIYSVGITLDKVGWASVVESQKLPWTNVCDGLGNGSRSLLTYNVTELPYMLILSQTGIEKVSGPDALKAAVSSKLGKR